MRKSKTDPRCGNEVPCHLAPYDDVGVERDES